MKKSALITGITGQDGSYLAELLIDKGYDVHGLIRRTSQFNRGRIEHARRYASDHGKTFELHYGNMNDTSSLQRVISLSQPSEVYNLAAQSHVGVSFDEPEYTTDVDATGVLRLLESIRYSGVECKFYQASTSELFGAAQQVPQNEQTPFHPQSTYGVAKLYAFWIVRHYREVYDFHASNGIFFNHESPRRGENFVTRKITYSIARIHAGLQSTLRLGNLDARRDWGYAKDYVYMMWKMLQMDHPDDYVIATGHTHTVREFVERAAGFAGFELVWEGQGVEEKGRDSKSGKILVEVDPRYYRPVDDTHLLVGDATKARNCLGWSPQTSFENLVEIMTRSDMERVRKEASMI
ncbi:MAG: GDP-mannose 4,6-dehydratase [Chitinivibrionales bacterium]